MRLLRYAAAGSPEPRLGLALPTAGTSIDAVLDLRGGLAGMYRAHGMDETGSLIAAEQAVPATMEGLIGRGPRALDPIRALAELAADSFGSSQKTSHMSFSATGAVRPVDSVRLLAPLTEPNSLRDFVAFQDHAEAGAARRGEELSEIWKRRPIYYKGNRRSILGPADQLRRPRFTQELDFELEVACIIGAKVTDVDEEGAPEAVFGFTVMNDWSARDVQREEMAVRLGPARSKDFATSLGPCVLVTDDPHPALKMRARVNGRTVCEANLADAYWRFPTIIAFLSAAETLYPTDLLGSGTPFGGCLLDQQASYLEPGDTVELEVEGIGALRTKIVD